jgi:DNA-binding CsgD family transcriptional regulator
LSLTRPKEDFHIDYVDGPADGQAAARTRGIVAVRIVGELVTRLAAADAWDFAAFGRDDDVLDMASSTSSPADVGALRAEVRLQRFTGAPMPFVSVALGADMRRSLCVIFGGTPERVAILRVSRGPAAKPFVARDGAGIERFFRQHSDGIAAAIFDGPARPGDHVAARRAAPIIFVVDAKGALLSTVDEPDADTASLRAHLLPTAGEMPPILRPVVSELLERYKAGAPAGELISVLPFALVRLTPLRSRVPPVSLVVSVEWLRSRASLEATAAQYSISKRELQVLSAMLRGAPVAEIAAELSISESTVVFHLKRMLKKTLSKNRTELAARMLGWDIAAVS